MSKKFTTVENLRYNNSVASLFMWSSLLFANVHLIEERRRPEPSGSCSGTVDILSLGLMGLK
jgi:hypothetical protein